ncbi:MAG TPA: hypothetical protein VGD80_13605 [Kofleriaceae bacterium]
MKVRNHVFGAVLIAALSFVTFVPRTASSSIQTVELQACKIYPSTNATAILCGVTGGSQLENGPSMAYFEYRTSPGDNVMHSLVRKTYTGSVSIDHLVQAGGGDVGLEAVNTRVDPSVWDFYYLSVDLLADGFVFDGVILVSN